MLEQDGGPGSPLRAVVEVVVKTLVDHPESVKVTESVRRGMTVVGVPATRRGGSA